MSSSTKPFDGAVRFEWFQSPAQLTLTFYVRDRQEGDVRVEAAAQSLLVSIRLDAAGREYQHNVDRLYSPLAAGAPVVHVRPMKVEVVLKKASESQWPALQAPDGDVALPLAEAPATEAARLPPTAKELSYPNSRGKDWSAVQLDDEDPKPEGEQALNALFQQIYGNGTDEQRRAMMKSFLESNGTVLSTNWEDVGRREVTAEPPTGMEAKPYTD
ncbi:phosphatase-like protein [Trypanosoma grayi]|uniref:phosphatase-like protein n=1 Tax=Trypanosoma grayi TaxID=71804 RepID=UPI0004F43C5E|nr:phosphatase-like protein [Trypanosoma grayi]KEG05450.1 phosphatase-like protein [Trypanosoma grayi]